MSFPTDLMGSTNEIHVMFVEKLCDHICTESEGDTTVVLAPAQHILIRVSPQKIAEEALVRYISGAHDPSNLLHRLEVWGQTWRRVYGHTAGKII